jgi:hypothetical protein
LSLLPHAVIASAAREIETITFVSIVSPYVRKYLGLPSSGNSFERGNQEM